MTLSSTVARTSYPGTGSTGPFAFPFRIFTETDLLVVKRSALFAETTLVWPADFTVAGVGNASGTISLTAALLGGENVFIRRKPPLTQPTSIRNAGPYFPATIEDEFDRLAMQLQSIQDQVDRSIKLKETISPLASLLELEPTNGMVIVGTGSGFAMSTVASGSVALPGSGRTVTTLAGYLLNNSVYNAKDYGCVGNNAVTDDTAPARFAFTQIPIGSTLLFPASRYKLTGGLTNTKAKVTVVGEGDATEFVCTFSGGSSTDAVFLSQNNDDFIVRDLKISGTHATGVDMFNGQRCRMLRLNISGGTLLNTHGSCSGIYTQSMNDLVIDSCVLSGNGSAVGENHGDIINNLGTYQITNSRITNNRCTSTLVNFNIACFDPRNVLIQGNECTGAIVSPVANVREGYGIVCYHTATGPTSAQVGEVRIIGNSVYSVQGTGIYLQDIRDSVISGNVVHDVGTAQSDASLPVSGIALDGAGPYVCTDNRIYNCGRDGITISACTGATVTSNRITNAANIAISIRGVTTDCIISDNDVFNVPANAKGIAMWSDTAATRITVANNRVRNLLGAGTSVGIQCTAATSAWTIVNNDVSGDGTNTAYGVAGTGHSFDRNKDEGIFVRERFSANVGDSDVTLTNISPMTIVYSSARTANRTVNLPAAALRNQREKILCTDTSAFTIDVGGVKTIPASTKAAVDVEYNDVATGWRLVGYSLL